jgi:integration host factor subunit alpha
MPLNRKELSAMLGEKVLFRASKCAEFVDLFFEVMTETLERGEKVKISGFGNFTVRKRRARRGRNPKTGEMIQISGRRVVTFKVSGVLRRALNRGAT